MFRPSAPNWITVVRRYPHDIKVVKEAISGALRYLLFFVRLHLSTVIRMLISSSLRMFSFCSRDDLPYREMFVAFLAKYRMLVKGVPRDFDQERRCIRNFISKIDFIAFVTKISVKYFGVVTDQVQESLIIDCPELDQLNGYAASYGAVESLVMKKVGNDRLYMS